MLDAFHRPLLSADLVALVPFQPQKPQRRPSDLVDLPYTSTLLLEVAFPFWVVADSSFSEACRVGFDAYFEAMASGSLGAIHYTDRYYCEDEVEQEVTDSMLACRRLGDCLAWRVGFTLGWLSALALVQPREAQVGLTLLTQLVRAELAEQAQ